MTVELCVLFPVLIVVAVICVNALVFISECASFDRASRNAVRTFASSPSTQDGLQELAAQIETAVIQEMEVDDIECSVEAADGSVCTFAITLSYSPTLFGMGLRDEVWGVPLPKLSHTSRLALEPYLADRQLE
ncbi:MAG: hypothetical protein HFJ65_02280 [Eggerthellaceae bacterium]|nr:hypothetical protein [Eggerthellaceae bacterium]